MKLTLWTYEGPPHVGAIRIAASMRGVHLVLHAPQGDTYADLLFTMIERRNTRPPVTYTTFQARDLGSDTAEIFKTAVRDAADRYEPDLLLVGASCTAELIQDDPGGLASSLSLEVPVIPLELPSYQRKENWGAAETFYQIVRQLTPGNEKPPLRSEGSRPSCNILGPTALGFHNRDDIVEIKKLIESLGISVNVVAPMGASPGDITNLGRADFNVVLYPEIAEQAASYLKRRFGQPMTTIIPIGVSATNDFISEIARLANITLPHAGASPTRLPWYSRSVDSTYLTGKRVFCFGDATHAIAAARIAKNELGFTVVGLGSYSREQARAVRAAATELGLEALITDDYLEVERQIQELQPELVLGTQMERHIAKRLRIPCAVISSPAHVQDFPARYSPQMGFEGANVLFDTWVHPLMMGLEEHLLAMFRDDFEFNDQATASHLGQALVVPASAPTNAPAESISTATKTIAAPNETAGLRWGADAETELQKIPFFVRGKARRNTERYATERGLATISLETLYDAKAHFSR